MTCARRISHRCPRRKEAQQESRARMEAVGHAHAASDELERAQNGAGDQDYRDDERCDARLYSNRAIEQQAHREQHHDDAAIELRCTIVVHPHAGEKAPDERFVAGFKQRPEGQDGAALGHGKDGRQKGPSGQKQPEHDGARESKRSVEHELPAKALLGNVIDKFDQYKDAEEQNADIGRVPAEHDVKCAVMTRRAIRRSRMSS